VRATLDEFFRKVGFAHALANRSVAILVFPTVVKAGFGIGGEYGEGAAPPHHGSPGRSGGSIIVSVTGSVPLTPSGLFLTLKPRRKQKTTKLANPITSRIPIKVSNDMAQSSPRWHPAPRTAPKSLTRLCWAPKQIWPPRSEMGHSRRRQPRPSVHALPLLSQKLT
jgi:hypothetical protein